MAKKKRRDKGSWLQSARESMERRGTVGKFGRATQKKIRAGLAKGGIQAKRAQFAENMKRLAQRRKRGQRKRSAD